MLTIIAIYGLFIFSCLGAITRPHLGVLGFYAFVLLQPEWNWRWHFPEPLGFQLYITLSTITGILLGYLHRSPVSPLVSRALIFLAFFIGLLFISYSTSIRQNETWLYVDSLWKIALMCFITVLTIDTPKRCLALMWVLVLSQGFNAYRINENYFQYGFSSYRSYGYGLSGDNNLYSLLTLPIFGCSVALACFSRKKIHRVVAGLIMLLQAHQIMLLESRGAMLGVVAISPLILWYIPKTRLNVLGLTVGIAGIAVLAGPSVINELLSIGGDAESGTLDASASSRFDLWKAGWEITKEHPLLGVGPWAAQWVVPKILKMDAETKGLHNIYFEISAGCGVPAAIFYFGFFSMCIFAGWTVLQHPRQNIKTRNRHDSDMEVLRGGGFAAVTGLLGYFIASIFSAGALLESGYAVAALGLCCYRVFIARKPGSVDELISKDESYCRGDNAFQDPDFAY